MAGLLSPGCHDLWRRMSGPDRRHAVGVARDVARTHPQPEVVAAALLHDVGKVASGLGTFARVPATLVGMAGGRRRAPVWRQRTGVRRRIGLYLDHPAIGAAWLRDASAHPLVSTWAAEHHLPPARWTVPADVGVALHAADDD